MTLFYCQKSDFQEEVKWLPFMFNLEALLDKQQISRFLDIIYNNKDVHSLHDEDLGYCDLHHLHNTDCHAYAYVSPSLYNMRHLQGEVCECINTCLQQGIFLVVFMHLRLSLHIKNQEIFSYMKIARNFIPLQSEMQFPYHT